MKELDTITKKYGFQRDEDGEVIGHGFDFEGLVTIGGVGKVFDRKRALLAKQVHPEQDPVDEQPSAEAA